MTETEERQNELPTTWISALKRSSQIYCANNLRSDIVGAGQLSFLVTLYKKDKVSQDYLAKRLFFDKATVARAMEALEKEGLVTRTECAEDKRKKIVSLTDKARAMQQTYTELIRDWNDVLLQGISDEEKRILIKLLMTMHDNATKHLEASGETIW